MALVLVVDDDPLVRSLIRVTLQRAGHEVIEAESGAEALQAERLFPVDLVFCDQAMPGMSGIEMLQQLRRYSPDLPFILLTGDVWSAWNCGCPLLAKPFRSAALIAAADEALAKQCHEPAQEAVTGAGIS